MTPTEWSTNLRAFAIGAAIMCAVALLSGCAGYHAGMKSERPGVTFTRWR